MELWSSLKTFAFVKELGKTPLSFQHLIATHMHGGVLSWILCTQVVSLNIFCSHMVEGMFMNAWGRLV